MAYLGTPPQSGFITTAKQRVTSSTNAYVDLDHAISSIADVIVFVNFVKQDTTNLTLTTSTRITLGATLVSSDIVEIHYLGKAVNTQTPATGTVTADALAGSIGLDKLSATGTKSSSTFLRGDNTFASAGASTLGEFTDVKMDDTNFVDSLLIQTDSDGSAPTTGTLSSADNNIGIGKDVFSTITSGNKNVAIGNNAGDAITTGYETIAIGHNACSALQNGEQNIGIGSGALDAQVGGGKAVAIGHDALGWLNGSHSVGVGCQSGGSSAGANSLYLGYQSYGAGNSDEIILTGSGNPISAGADTLTFGKNGNRVYNQFNSNNNWTHSSDERMKKNIQDETLGLSFINRLRPVTYNFRLPSEYPEDFPYYDAEDKNPKTDVLQHGIIAQEVKAAMEAEGNDTFNGYQLANDGVHSVSESNFVYPMIKAMQELSAKVDALETENTALKARVKTLEEG